MKKSNQRLAVIIFGCIHAGVMLATTVWSSLHISILQTGHLFQEPWFIATLVDTYLSFLVVYLWLAITERSKAYAVISFIGFMCLGNIAIGLALALRAYGLHDAFSWTAFMAGKLNTNKKESI